ncbi:hypothetical protein SCLCIDRAFT_19280 [Scleroderma citrinum Foug A]|uniref:Uncharacterized protein n=1 Tax=Scleroderma citrinum Foug A TaxID=1036808 RepID=A0A0C3A6N5_9AGAM|nr:hypothetical protein SCLCIDRAFT_19280 [Scleroderma citrinum Foug A]
MAVASLPLTFTTNSVAQPFGEWASLKETSQEQLSLRKGTLLHTWVRVYKDAQKEVIKLKSTYFTKTREADEGEDESVIVIIYGCLL